MKQNLNYIIKYKEIIFLKVITNNLKQIVKKYFVLISLKELWKLQKKTTLKKYRIILIIKVKYKKIINSMIKIIKFNIMIINNKIYKKKNHIFKFNIKYSLNNNLNNQKLKIN